MKTVAILASVMALAAADGGHGGHGGGHGGHGGYGHEVYAHTPPHYSYKYGVSAPGGKHGYGGYSGPVNFGHNEERDGYATKGSYYVDLPDGRRQIVTYHVGDGYSGYVADVKYEPIKTYEPVHHASSGYHDAPVHHGGAGIANGGGFGGGVGGGIGGGFGGGNGGRPFLA